MSSSMRFGRRLVGVAALGGAIALGATFADAQQPRPAPRREAAPAFTVDGQLALHSLMALTDAHLKKTADVLTILATTDDVRSTDWERVRSRLAEAANVTVPAVHWFALPDGTYWTVERGLADTNLADRPYFPQVLAGQTVIGDLVVSRSTNQNTAIVAVPVRGPDGSVVGVLGNSVHLDALSTQLREELGGLDEGHVFFAIDDEPLGALHSDPALIFRDPMRIGDAGMRRAFRRMLTGQEGVVSYDFRGGQRTVLYRKSPVTGWWYGFGAVQPA